MATEGHDFFLLNNTKSPGIYSGVNCLSLPLTNLAQAKRRELDAFVVLNLTGYGGRIRSHIGKFTKLILWTGHKRDEFPLRQIVDYINQGFTHSGDRPNGCNG